GQSTHGRDTSKPPSGSLAAGRETLLASARAPKLLATPRGGIMRQMQKVLWQKGVLLSPQHLPTQDRFLEDLIGFQLSSLAFCPWGFTRLEVDREALAGGTLAISAASGLMPDGLPFDIPAADAAPPPKPLEELWHPDAQAP